MKSELRVFVYGTLRKGHINHDRYCSGVLGIHPAWLPRGRLYRLTPEIPIMKIPDEDVLLNGTASIAADLNVQEKLRVFLEKRRHEKPPESDSSEKWKVIEGELLIFNDPVTRLPLLDSLEEFRPGGPSTYIRTLVSAMLPGGSRTSAWTYIAGIDTSGLSELD